MLFPPGRRSSSKSPEAGQQGSSFAPRPFGEPRKTTLETAKEKLSVAGTGAPAIQRTIVGTGGEPIWGTEIAERLATEENKATVEAVHRLHSTNVPVVVASYADLVNRIAAHEFDALIAASRAESKEAKYEVETPAEAAGMVSVDVAYKIIANLRAGTPPFRPELGLGGCSWFIWKGHGVPYTSIDKVKPDEAPKNVPLNATVRLPANALIFTTAWLAARHAEFLAALRGGDGEARFRAYKEIPPDKPLNRRERDALNFYLSGLAEHRMWVDVGQAVAAHPSRVGVVVLTGSAFSRSGDGKFLVVADAARIEIPEEEVRHGVAVSTLD